MTETDAMPPMLFTALIGLIFNLFFAGVLPQQVTGAYKLDGAIGIDISKR